MFGKPVSLLLEREIEPKNAPPCAARFGIILQPGQRHFYDLARVSSAAPGRGYKEDLDFKFYPLAQRGAYDVEGRAVNLFNKDVPGAKVRVWIK